MPITVPACLCLPLLLLLQVFTPLQCTRLLLGSDSKSYLMDVVQFCQLLDAQWQQQWGTYPSAADRGHLLASAADAV